MTVDPADRGVDTLSADQLAYWQAYLEQCPERARVAQSKVVAGLAGDEQITDRLIDLYLQGTKYAGSGLVAEYEFEGEPLPVVGDHWIALGADGEPRCILHTTAVETHVFRDVPERIALAEGEGDLSLDYWKREHAAFYGRFLQQWGIEDIDAALVVTEFFELVFPAHLHHRSR